MNIPNIDSKVMARAFALAMAIKYRGSIVRGNTKYSLIGSTTEQAKQFEEYLIGDADLPEVKEDPTKDWIETMKSIHEQQSTEEREKREEDWQEFMANLARQVDENNAKLGIR